MTEGSWYEYGGQYTRESFTSIDNSLLKLSMRSNCNQLIGRPETSGLLRVCVADAVGSLRTADSCHAPGGGPCRARVWQTQLVCLVAAWGRFFGLARWCVSPSSGTAWFGSSRFGSRAKMACLVQFRVAIDVGLVLHTGPRFCG